MFAWYNRWRAARLEAKFKAAISFCEKQRPDMFQRFIAERATELAARILMDMLDKEGIRHCFRCPSRQQLRHIAGRFLCPTHAQLAEAQAAMEKAKAAPLHALVLILALLVAACQRHPNRVHLYVDLPGAYEPVGRNMTQTWYDAENTKEREYTTTVKITPADASHKLYIATFILELEPKSNP